MEKPEFIYHGSPKGDIAEFVARVSMGSGEEYGPQVYASHDLAAASIFMVDVEKYWSAGEINDVLYVIIPLSREEFLARDNGGFLYTLPSDDFSSDPQKGMDEKERASFVPVKPIAMEQVSSVLDYMLTSGVQVYFVTDEQYSEIYASDQVNLKFLRNLHSENEARGVNVKSLFS